MAAFGFFSRYALSSSGALELREPDRPGDIPIYVVKPQKPGLELQVKRRNVADRPTYHYHIFGRSDKAQVFYDRNSVVNQISAIINRSNTIVPITTPPTGEEVQAAFAWIDSHFHYDHSTIRIDHATALEYVEQTNWPMWKKKQWLLIVKEFLDTMDGGAMVYPHHEHGRNHNFFLKDESYPTADKPPRMIADAQPVVRAVHALVLFQFSKAFFSRSNRLVVKHLDMDERVARLQSLRGDTYGRNDCSAWEASVSPTWLSVERSFYERHGITDPYLMYDFSAPLDLKSRTLTARLSPSRMSGDYNTSLGNSIINLVAIHIAAQRAGVHVEAIVEGDDAIIAFRGAPGTFADHFRSLGFLPDFATYDLPGEAGFCGLRYDDNGRFFDPKIVRKLLTGDPLNLPLKDYRAARIRSALDLDPTNPFLHILFERYPTDFKITEDKGQGQTGRYLGRGQYLVKADRLQRPDIHSWERRYSIDSKFLSVFRRLDTRRAIELYMDLAVFD